MSRALLASAAALAVLALGACGEDTSLEVGKCTDAEPNFVIPGVEPELVDCDSDKAKSKLTKKVDDPEDCSSGAYIKQLSSNYCAEPIEGKALDLSTIKAPPPPDFSVPTTTTP